MSSLVNQSTVGSEVLQNRVIDKLEQQLSIVQEYVVGITTHVFATLDIVQSYTIAAMNLWADGLSGTCDAADITALEVALTNAINAAVDTFGDDALPGPISPINTLMTSINDIKNNIYDVGRTDRPGELFSLLPLDTPETNHVSGEQYQRTVISNLCQKISDIIASAQISTDAVNSNSAAAYYIASLVTDPSSVVNNFEANHLNETLTPTQAKTFLSDPINETCLTTHSAWLAGEPVGTAQSYLGGIFSIVYDTGTTDRPGDVLT